MRRHDSLFRDCLNKYHGKENKETGDGFLATFDTGAEAVACALEFLAYLPSIDSPEALACRIGIHAGTILTIQHAENADGQKLLGVAADLAARIMSLAEGGQILLSQGVFDAARVELEHGPDGTELAWHAHGPYLFRGMEEPVEIFEVGVAGVSKLKAPPGGKDIERDVSIRGAETLGWRPAVGQTIPGRPGWRLQKRLGTGGMGEVWVAGKSESPERRAFKFCFDIDHLRSLRREHTLFRVMREALGERPDIARLFAIRLEAAPYYLEMEYSPGGDLLDWSEARGGVRTLSLETRLEIVAQVATALGAAHSVGVLHKDLKPANVLMDEGPDGAPRAKITDFGIGALVDHHALDAAGITASGLTEGAVALPQRGSSQSGTRIYMAPELLAGKPATIQSDLYSLGVMLFQMIAGDLAAPVGTGWERRIDDELLREDVAACIDFDPGERLAGASDLARRLRGLGERRKAREAIRQAEAAAKRQSRLRRQLILGTTLGVVLAFVAGVIAFRERRLLDDARKSRQLAEQRAAESEYEQYVAGIQSASYAFKEGRLDVCERTLLSLPERHRNWEWGYLMRQVHPETLTLAGHTAGLRCARFSPDGLKALTVSDDMTAKIWDLTTGNELVTLRGHAKLLQYGEFSPDGERVITASSDGTARLWSVSGQLIAVLPHKESVNKVRFSPSGAMILTASDDMRAGLWDGRTGKHLRWLEGHTKWIWDADFSPDGRWVATACDEGVGRLWDIATGEAHAILSGAAGELNSVAFSPEGRLVAMAGSDAATYVWEVPSGKLVYRLDDSGGIRRGANFSPSGEQLLTFGDDGEVRVFDVKTGKRIVNFNAHTNEVKQAVFISDGFIYSVGKDRTLRLLRPEWRVTDIGKHENFINWVDYKSSRGYGREEILTASGDGTAKLWMPSVSSSPGCYGPMGGEGRAARFSSDDKRLLTSGVGPSASLHGLWGNPANGFRRFIVGGDLVSEADISPDSRRIAASAVDGKVRVWDADSEALLRVYTGHQKEIRGVRFSPDGAWIASSSDDHTAQVWPVDEKAGAVKMLLGHEDWVMSVRFSPDGTRLVTASNDGSVRIWSFSDGKELFPIRKGKMNVDEANFDPSGTRIVVAWGDWTAGIYDARDGSLLAEMKGHEAGVTSAVFSADGLRVATGAGDGTMRIWDARTGRELMNWTRNATATVRGLNFCPRGDHLAGGIDQTTSIWNSVPFAGLQHIGDTEEQFHRALYAWEKKSFVVGEKVRRGWKSSPSSILDDPVRQFARERP